MAWMASSIPHPWASAATRRTSSSPGPCPPLPASVSSCPPGSTGRRTGRPGPALPVTGVAPVPDAALGAVGQDHLTLRQERLRARHVEEGGEQARGVERRVDRRVGRTDDAQLGGVKGRKPGRRGRTIAPEVALRRASQGPAAPLRARGLQLREAASLGRALYLQCPKSRADPQPHAPRQGRLGVARPARHTFPQEGQEAAGGAHSAAARAEVCRWLAAPAQQGAGQGRHRVAAGGPLGHRGASAHCRLSPRRDVPRRRTRRAASAELT